MKKLGQICCAACALLFALGLSACSSSSATAISFTSAVPTTLQVGNTLAIDAMVNGKSSVSWTATCGNPGACGVFNPPMTSSGIVTTYAAPAAIPPGGIVTLTATSTAASGQSVSADVMIITKAPIIVTFAAPPPPPTMTPNSGAIITAKISNDPIGNGGSGVDWSVSCGSPGACGTVFPLHTNVGDTTLYSSPAGVPTGSTVTLTATSTTDPSVSHSATIIISASLPVSFLSGSYTFVVSGVDVNGRNCIAGVLQADGNGNITGGEQDIFNFGIGHSHDSFTGSYLIEPDGHGTVTLNTGNPKLGIGGTETLGVALVSSSHALVAEFDSSATSSGTMDLQTLASFSSSTLAGGYAFALSGQDLSMGMVMGANAFLHQPFTLGGVLNVDSPGAISGTGSVVDSNDNGTLNLAQGVTGTITAPDARGRVQLTLTLASFASNFTVIGYISDAAHLKLVEIDGNNGVTAGVAAGQGANTGTFTQPSAFNGSFVLAASGASPVTSPPALPMALAATLISDSVSNLLSGPFDVNAAGVATKGMITGTYSLTNASIGRVLVTLTEADSTTFNFAVYLTGSADPPPVIEVDATAITSGFAYPQAAGEFSASNFQGPYSMNLTLVQFDGSAQSDASGQALADGLSSFAATWNFNGNGLHLDIPATGSFSFNPNGRFPGSMTASLAFNIPRTFSYYVLNSSQVICIETGGLGVGLGVFEMQLFPL